MNLRKARRASDKAYDSLVACKGPPKTMWRRMMDFQKARNQFLLAQYEIDKKNRTKP